MSRLFGLLGSGEFEPWSADVDAWLLERATGDGRVLVLPTASAREGAGVFDAWARKGVAHYRGLGAEAQVVDVRSRDEASRPEAGDAVRGASMVFFSGGNPAFLASVLTGTALWSTLTAELDRGMAYAGCSAGVACLGRLAPDSDRDEVDESVWQPGLGLFRRAWFGPHWDALDSYQPGLTEFIAASVPHHDVLVGIDEETALVGDGLEWQVVGRSAAHVREGTEWASHTASDGPFALDLVDVRPGPVRTG